ncbi:glycine cleavage system aminomethyltransferase GcvT [Arsenicitalea aurantiaca]|uniref:aminomethyltransferase n=1 Tax=Arsenicitalea aurantiaca TaxID=1783274 RepID=A0A433XAR3_9HYPH|nr:glycine cleavage system aminomethyltransferase GcvT [Arsenicitalea aurantiaca]RUT31166.1 glycine cleavage system aminomethyltransferase GcvT [Arsenicitalea aurantiaca]
MANAPGDDTLKTTLLNSRHVALGGRIVPFSGYALPVQYPSGIIAEHNWTREHAGLFDVSHMGPAFLMLAERTGEPEADHAAIAALIEPLVSADVRGMKPGQLRYSLLLDERGGILDDLMLARPASPDWAGVLFLVVNAGTKDDDFARISAACGTAAQLNRADNCALLALQGPEAVAVMAAAVPGAQALGFMQYESFDWGGTRLVVSRSGYTGEDGFEVLVAPEQALAFWDTLAADPRVRPAGLGARDSLRLEAGLPLYGHDLDTSVSPIEAGLGFALSKRRRLNGDFPGAERILGELDRGPSRLRLGLLVDGAPAREGASILDADGAEIGRVTSGGFSPTLGRAIAMGFVPPAFAAEGTELQVSVRGRAQRAVVTPMPFVPHRYFRKSSSSGI